MSQLPQIMGKKIPCNISATGLVAPGLKVLNRNLFVTFDRGVTLFLYIGTFNQ